MRYRDAGVDVGRSDALKHQMLDDVASTWTPGVRRLPRGFAGAIAWPEPPGALAGDRLLLATMDGVGTKLHLALAAGRVADAAADLVAHGANDLLVHGGRPWAFLDYVAQERLDPVVVREVVRGLARACRELGVALLGGETAEMPDTYRPDVVDVAGCMIGWVERGTLLDGSRVRAGDRVLGLGSEGLHTNGYSLARRVLAASGLGLTDPVPGGDGETIAEALLAPHRAYARSLLPEIGGARVHALAHVTGGGLAANLARVIPDGLTAVIDTLPERPAVFRWLCDAGGITDEEATRAFNLGVGFVVIVEASEAPTLARDLEARGERVFELGSIVAGETGVEWRVG